MAKKKKHGKGGAFGRESNVQKSTDDANATGESRLKTGVFCLKSSLGVPFLVISDSDFVTDVPAPNACESKELMEMATGIISQWSSRGAVITADFEGEFTGLEGELVSAAFQRTWAIDPQGLRPMPCKGPSRDMGLLLDLRSAAGAALTKRIMENEVISKVIWGADGDVTSLRYTPLRSPLSIHSTQVIDAQLAFSSSKHRLAMSTMLERLPPSSISGLPSKSVLDFESHHALNSRALKLPLGKEEAMYAVDDLHRLDAILREQRPKDSCYKAAERLTSAAVSLVLHNIAGASQIKLQMYERMFSKKSGTEKQAIAVRVKRHLIALRRLVTSKSDQDFEELEKEAEKTLADARVSIPEDLSFAAFTEMPKAAQPPAQDESEEEEADKSDGEDKIVEANAVPRKKRKKRKAQTTDASTSGTTDAIQGTAKKKRKIKQSAGDA